MSGGHACPPLLRSIYDSKKPRRDLTDEYISSRNITPTTAGWRSIHTGNTNKNDLPMAVRQVASCIQTS